MTGTAFTTLREMAANSLQAVRIFEKHGLDYCCGGDVPLNEACAAKGIAPAQIEAELEAAAAAPQSNDVDWAAAPLAALVEHIVGVHHEYLRRELPALAERLQRLATKRAQDEPVLVEIERVFTALREELEAHLWKEENVLFPVVLRYEFAASSGLPLPPVPFGTVENPIRMMEAEHDNAGNALALLRQLTNGYAVPGNGCATYKAAFAGLAALEADLHMHIHLENNILFPRAAALEAQTA
jgi:regulator of cell morphogenesis and NO signaling